jgi:hypothetical protein
MPEIVAPINDAATAPPAEAARRPPAGRVGLTPTPCARGRGLPVPA